MQITIKKNKSLWLKLQAISKETMNFIENKSHFFFDYTTNKKRNVAHSAFLYIFFIKNLHC
ncbi:hypothetical protein A3782_21980 [Bacillus sp. GZT]|nr:hypothetical protein A3782_21980 [Bacillus sp. GZT]